jgi:hypothetical protein
MPNAVTSKGTTRGGGRGTRQSCDEMGVEALGNATTNQMRGAQKSGSVMNGGGRGAGRRCNLRRCWFSSGEKKLFFDLQKTVIRKSTVCPVALIARVSIFNLDSLI